MKPAHIIVSLFDLLLYLFGESSYERRKVFQTSDFISTIGGQYVTTYGFAAWTCFGSDRL